jgi:iron complex outermembrane receptor protein
MRNYLIITVFLISLITINLYAQDSIRVYQLGTVEVMDKKDAGNIQFSSFEKINYYNLRKLEPILFSEIKQIIPTALVYTNSRGEMLINIRNSDERQLGLFFDGATLNIPWDNRFDMTFVPMDIVGSINVNTSPSSILYGANILAGAIDIATIERQNNGIGGNFRLSGNDASTMSGALTLDGRYDKFNFIVNTGYTQSDGFLNSLNTPDMPNQTLNTRLRTNTDFKKFNAYARGEYHFSDNTKYGLSVNYTNGDKGVAPEGFNPGPRFWRYPDWNRTIFTLNGVSTFSTEKDMTLRSTLWYDYFTQTINSYENITYKDLIEKQIDLDNSIGGRLVFSTNTFANQKINIVLNGLYSEHNEKIKSPSDSLKSDLDFSSLLISGGADYNFDWQRYLMSFGLTYDYLLTPKTGVFTENEDADYSDFGAYASFSYLQSDNLRFIANLSRRTRFQTMREAYSGALGKFLVNPDLKPENAINAELKTIYELSNFEISAALFGRFTNDLIIQKTVVDPIDGKKKKQRFNLSESQNYGVDLNTTYRFPFNLSATLYFLYMYSTGKEEGNKIEHLEYKPEILADLFLDYGFSFGLNLHGEVVYTGEQWGINVANDAWEKIDPTFQLNFTVSQKLPYFIGFAPKVFVKVNNITDEYVQTRIGLPEPGRMFYFGISSQF